MIKSRELKTAYKEYWPARWTEEMFTEMRSCWCGLTCGTYVVKLVC